MQATVHTVEDAWYLCRGGKTCWRNTYWCNIWNIFTWYLSHSILSPEVKFEIISENMMIQIESYTMYCIFLETVLFKWRNTKIIVGQCVVQVPFLQLVILSQMFSNNYIIIFWLMFQRRRIHTCRCMAPKRVNTAWHIVQYIHIDILCCLLVQIDFQVSM